MGAGGALSFAVFFSNCGGSSGGRQDGRNDRQRTGTAGTQGSAGTSGGGGVTGSAGTTGMGGRFTCASEQSLNCSAALTLPDGHVTTFSRRSGARRRQVLNASGLRGSIFSYSGGGTGDVR